MGTAAMAMDGTTLHCEERDPVIVVAISIIAFVLVEYNDLCIPNVLGYRALFLALEQKLKQVSSGGVLSSCLHNLWWNSITV